MTLGFELANAFGASMRQVVEAAAKVSGPLSSKYLEAHAVRVETDAELYEDDQLRQADYFLRAALYKLQLSQVSLEQFWALSYDRRDRMITEALEGSLRKLDAEVRNCHTRQLGHLNPEELHTLIDLLRRARAPHEPTDSEWH